MKDLDNWVVQTANIELPVLEGITLPITVRCMAHPWIMMINFSVIYKYEKSIMEMGADELQKFGAIIQFGDCIPCPFQGNPTLYCTEDHPSRIEERNIVLEQTILYTG